jgi:hypothetical protein
MKQQVKVGSETYIVETAGRQFKISKKSGKIDVEDAVLVMQAIQDGKGNVIKK